MKKILTVKLPWSFSEEVEEEKREGDEETRKTRKNQNKRERERERKVFSFLVWNDTNKKKRLTNFVLASS